MGQRPSINQSAIIFQEVEGKHTSQARGKNPRNKRHLQPQIRCIHLELLFQHDILAINLDLKIRIGLWMGGEIEGFYFVGVWGRPGEGGLGVEAVGGNVVPFCWDCDAGEGVG